jgi:hypothetical protein
MIPDDVARPDTRLDGRSDDRFARRGAVDTRRRAAPSAVRVR